MPIIDGIMVPDAQEIEGWARHIAAEPQVFDHLVDRAINPAGDIIFAGGIIDGGVQAALAAPAPKRWQDFVNQGVIPAAPVAYFNYEFEGVMLRVPDWTTHIAQDKNGQIRAYDHEPVNLGDYWVKRNPKQKTQIVAKPELYQMVCEEI